MQITKKYDLYRIIILFSLGFFIGCIYMNCLWRMDLFLQISERKYAMDMLYEQEHYKKFWELSFGILGAIVYLLTLISGYTKIGNALPYGFCLVFGIWWGAFLTECMIIKGIYATWYVIKIVMPEIIIYVGAYIFAFIWSCNMSTLDFEKKKLQKKSFGNSGGILVISIILFVFWLICSFYVNCHELWIQWKKIF